MDARAHAATDRRRDKDKSLRHAVDSGLLLPIIIRLGLMLRPKGPPQKCADQFVHFGVGVSEAWIFGSDPTLAGKEGRYSVPTHRIPLMPLIHGFIANYGLAVLGACANYQVMLVC